MLLIAMATICTHLSAWPVNPLASQEGTLILAAMSEIVWILTAIKYNGHFLLQVNENSRSDQPTGSTLTAVDHM